VTGSGENHQDDSNGERKGQRKGKSYLLGGKESPLQKIRPSSEKKQIVGQEMPLLGKKALPGIRA